jgi:hypothetical protein
MDELISEEIRYLDPELNCDPQFLKIRNRKCTGRCDDGKSTLLSNQLISAEIAYLDPEFDRDRASAETNDYDGTSPEANRSFWTTSLVVVTILSLACLIIVVEWLSGQLR